MASPPTMIGGGRSDSCEDDSASLSSSTSDTYSPNFYQQPRYRRQRTTSCRSSGSQNGTGRKTMIDKSQPKLCVICGDKAKGVNFNALTCMSCKAFFRRNALRNKEMKCPFQDRCSVDKITRKFCSKCRLKKCFDSGMKKEWILSEEEKLAIKEKIARNRARRQEESAQTGNACGSFSETNGRKRGRKSNATTTTTTAGSTNPASASSSTSSVIESKDYSCDVLDGLEFLGSIDQQLSVGEPTNGNVAGSGPNTSASGLEIFQSFQLGSTDSVQISNDPSIINRTSYPLQSNHQQNQQLRQSQHQQPPQQSQAVNGQQQQQQQQQNQHSHPPQGSSIFCLEPFDTLSISGGEQVFEWSPSGQNTNDAGIVDSLTNDLNDCCQILFANDLFDSEVIKNDFIDIEQPSSSSDFSQYLLHGTDPNIQNGRAVPLLSCAQQFQQKQCASTINSGTKRHVMSRLSGPIDDIDAELPDFLSVCLGSNNLLQSRSESHDPACGPSIAHGAVQQPLTLPDDLAFLSSGLIQPEKELLAELSEACKVLETPYRRMIDYERCESLRTSRVTEHTLLRMIAMSKKLSTFTKLAIQDRVKLLKYNLIEMLGIRSVLFYLPDREAWSMINDEFKINVLIKMNVIRPFCTRAMWQRHKEFPLKFRTEWLRDTTIFDLLTVIVLFTPHPSISNQTTVLDEQRRYSYLLRRYLETKYACNTTSKEVYDLLMECVKEMRELNGDIVNFFRGYHRLIGGSPLFTQILELPPTAECLERQNEILTALTEDMNIMNSGSDYCSSTAYEFANNTVHYHHHHHHLNHNHHHLLETTSNLFNADTNGGTIEVNGQKTASNISTNNSTVTSNTTQNSAQQNCFGILNSVN